MHSCGQKYTDHRHARKTEFIRNSNAQTEIDECTGKICNAKFEQQSSISSHIHRQRKKIGWITESQVWSVYFCSGEYVVHGLAWQELYFGPEKLGPEGKSPQAKSVAPPT